MRVLVFVFLFFSASVALYPVLVSFEESRDAETGAGVSRCIEDRLGGRHK